ncbi:MAG: hypothetical protein JWL93_1915 [Hyphomicrobiales bacterium]|jgi:hypothetical protein|nr:hypothetical protein [Hyphomicrobiales bacterium]
MLRGLKYLAAGGMGLLVATTVSIAPAQAVATCTGGKNPGSKGLGRAFLCQAYKNPYIPPSKKPSPYDIYKHQSKSAPPVKRFK